MPKKKRNVVKDARRRHKAFESDLYSMPDRGKQQGFDAHYDRAALLRLLKRIAQLPCECEVGVTQSSMKCAACQAAGE